MKTTKSEIWIVDNKQSPGSRLIGRIKPKTIVLESETKGRIRQDGREVIKHGDSWFYVVE